MDELEKLRQELASIIGVLEQFSKDGNRRASCQVQGKD